MLSLPPTAQMPEKVVPGSPSRWSRTAGASGAGPRVASGSEASPVVLDLVVSSPGVVSSRSSACPVVSRPPPEVPVSSEQEMASKQRKVETAAARALAGARWLGSHTSRILSEREGNFRLSLRAVRGVLPAQGPRAQEHGVEHRGGENTGEGVLLGWVIAAEEGGSAGHHLGAVAKPGFGPEPVEAEGGVPGEGAEADDDLRLQQFQLPARVGEAGVAFCGGGPVLRRGAPDGGGDPEPVEFESVFAVARDGSARKAGTVQRSEEEVARPVAREEAAGPVRAVGRRGEAEDHDPRVRVAEARDGAPPVSLIAEGRTLLAGDLLAPLDEPRTAPARGDLPLQGGEFL